MASASLFAPVAKHRVTPDHPPRDEYDLDAERCAALHNTIMLYGWVCSGRKIAEMERKSWWSKHGTPELKELLRPSLVKYLSKIFDVSGHNFFYFLNGLAMPNDMLYLGNLLADEDHDPRKVERHRFIVLYSTHKDLVSQPAGIVYDQKRHMALLMPTYHHVFDLKNPDIPWQRLESILSAYIDMTEAEKSVALHRRIGAPATETEEAGPVADPVTGAKRSRYNTHPWTLQPYTLADLNNCLKVWRKLFRVIETKAGMDLGDDGKSSTLCSKSALNAAGIPKGFAYDLLSHARQPQIWFIAPGIRLPKVEEFLQQPFRDVLAKYPKETQGIKAPFLFFRCEGTVSAKEAKFRWPFSTVERVPCGLYLDAFPNNQSPFEDACRLVLPIQLGSNKYARTSDFRPIRKSYSDLYQTEINPYVMRHGPKLIAVLESWLENVESGHWDVNDKGVMGGVGVWRAADTRDDWWRYQSKHLSV